MLWTHNQYQVTDDLNQIDLAAVHELLKSSYWANERSREDVEASFRSAASVCFGVLHEGKTVGCARLITDRLTFSWLCDVIIHPEHQGKGLGKFLIKTITEDAELGKIRTLLGTRDAHGLYEQFGFVRKEMMIRKKK